VGELAGELQRRIDGHHVAGAAPLGCPSGDVDAEDLAGQVEQRAAEFAKVGNQGAITPRTQYMLPTLKLKRHLTAAPRPERLIGLRRETRSRSE